MREGDSPIDSGKRKLIIVSTELHRTLKIMAAETNETIHNIVENILRDELHVQRNDSKHLNYSK